MSKRILFAEDDRDTRELLTSIAQLHGHEVVAVPDGVELLLKAEKEKFDVIITDLMMKDLTGASASAILKLQGNVTPVIALTALRAEDMELMKDRFTRIFYKPCNIGEILDYIDSIK